MRARGTLTSRPGLLVRLRSGADGRLGDSLAMSLAAGEAAIVGMVSWILGARALTPAELGTATAFVSAFLLVAGCSEFRIGLGMLQWLPRAGGADSCCAQPS